MNKRSRTANSLLNFISNIIYQLFIILLSFATRRVFIGTLGYEYLGINSLFNNIISVLSLAELGISSAMSYSMYKNIAREDKNKIAGIINYYKTLYNRIALIVLIIGLLLMPFLRLIVNLDNEMPHLELYYFITLLSSVASYLFVYKTTIIVADQSSYKVKWLSIIIQIFKSVVGILIIRFLKNYVVYLSVEVFIGILGNYICSKYAEILYPFIKDKTELSKNDKDTIWSNIKSMFIYKLAGVIINNTDNILISVIINTITVGLYSNYLMIINKISALIDMFFNSISASVGNLNANSDYKQQYDFFKVLLFFTFCFMLIATAGVVFVGEEVIITMTQSKNSLLGTNLLLLIAINFYIAGMSRPIWTFRTTSGLFKIAKWSMFICAFLNVILSIVLGIHFGIEGIVLATIISRVLTIFWYEPYVLYKKIFFISPVKFFKKYVIYSLILVIDMLLINVLIKYVSLDNLYLRIFVKSFICVAISSLMIFVSFFRSKEMKYILEKIGDVFRRLKEYIR